MSDSTPSIVRRLAQQYTLDHEIDVLTRAHALLHSDTSVHQISGITKEETAALNNETESRWRQPWTLYFTIAVCSLGAIEQGWAQTSINGANLYLPAAFGIGSNSPHDTLVVGLINSGIYLSTAVVGAWSSDPINNWMGRRGAIFLASTVCLVANLGSALSRTWPVLLAFRFLLGIGLGVNASTVSVYAAECAPVTIRGGLAVSWQMFTALGIFLGFVANVTLFDYGPDSWRYQLGAALIPTVPLLFTIYSCPESPSWYLKNDSRYDLAFISLCRLRNTKLQAARDLYSVYLHRDLMSSVRPGTQKTFVKKLLDFVTVPRVRRAALASYVVMLSQQLCGINIIAFYSSTIFAESGFTTFNALLASCLFGLVNFLGAFPAIWTMDSLGRRALLLLTLPFMSLTMSAAGLSFYIPTETPAHFVVLAVLIYLFCGIYSPGMGPVPSAYTAEIFPLSHRELGMTLGVSTANAWAAILSLTFPSLLNRAGQTATFTLYAVLNLLALLLVFLFVPETRLKTLEEMDEVFDGDVGVWDDVKWRLGTWLPWAGKKYVLGRKGVEEPTPSTVGVGPGGRVSRGRTGYAELDQDERGEGDES